jgi:hypothetical protein
VKNEIEVDPSARWVRCVTLCNFLDISADTVARRATPWQETPVPHKFRFRELMLDAGAKPEKRYWFPDALSFLRNPPPSQLSRRLSVAPVFHV